MLLGRQRRHEGYVQPGGRIGNSREAAAYCPQNAAKASGKGAAGHLKPGKCLTSLSEATRKALGNPVQARLLPPECRKSLRSGKAPKRPQTPPEAFGGRLVPKVAVWSLPSLSEASRKSQGKCSADGQRWPKADGQGRLSGRCKPQRHFFSDALPLQLLGVGGYRRHLLRSTSLARQARWGLQAPGHIICHSCICFGGPEGTTIAGVSWC